MPVITVLFCLTAIGSFFLTSYFSKNSIKSGSARFVKYTPSIFFLLISLLFFYLAKNEQSLMAVAFVLIGVIQVLIFIINLIIAVVYEVKYRHKVR